MHTTQVLNAHKTGTQRVIVVNTHSMRCSSKLLLNAL
jgi:hypothetical protein